MVIIVILVGLECSSVLLFFLSNEERVSEASRRWRGEALWGGLRAGQVV